MIICDYYRQFKTKRLVVGLGYFDSVHKGHVRLIDEVKRLATTLKAEPAIFTFSTNPFRHFGADTDSIFSFSERCRRLEQEGVEVVIGVDAKDDFFKMQGSEFLDIMMSNFDIVGFVSGSDYTYGSKASGNSDSLISYAKSHEITAKVIDLVEADGRKISSRDIRDMLSNGEIDRANTLLSQPYSVSGKVREGRRDGAKIGFPTANIDLEEDILPIKRGVYSSVAVVGDKKYRAVTNVGGHPTFGDNRENIEAYILDFDGSIYGEDIEIIFYRWLRGVRKFESVKELQETIARDEITTRREVDL